MPLDPPTILAIVALIASGVAYGLGERKGFRKGYRLALDHLEGMTRTTLAPLSTRSAIKTLRKEMHDEG